MSVWQEIYALVVGIAAIGLHLPMMAQDVADKYGRGSIVIPLLGLGVQLFAIGSLAAMVWERLS